MTASTITRLELDVNPVPLARPRVVDGRAFTPARSAAFCEEFRWALRAAGWRRPIEVGLELGITLWRQHRGNNRGDLDNHVKAVLDAGNGFLWGDDRQIVAFHARFAAAGPRVVGAIHLELTYPATIGDAP